MNSVLLLGIIEACFIAFLVVAVIPDIIKNIVDKKEKLDGTNIFMLAFFAAWLAFQCFKVAVFLKLRTLL